jgi:hypothetical protein
VARRDIIVSDFTGRSVDPTELVTVTVRYADARRAPRPPRGGAHDRGRDHGQARPAGGGMTTTREILIHLNVTVPDGDQRDSDEIERAVMGALEVGSDHDDLRGLEIVAALSEEI